jgi:uncharacterized iron-regulated membrane protein
MRRLLFNLHLYTALIAAVFIVIFGVTGSIMAFEPVIDHLLHWRLAYVTPGAKALSLGEIAVVIAKKFPGEQIAGFELSTKPDLSYRVGLRSRVVYVNQYTGEVLGVRQGGIDFLGYVHQLHLRLLLLSKPRLGKQIMSWAGVAMLFLAVSGVYLWWPYKRVKVEWRGSAKRVWFDIHNVVGIFSFLFLLTLGATGVVIGFEEHTTPLFYQITGSEPAAPPDVSITPPPGAKAIGLDRALEIARAALPGATPFLINAPEPKEPYYVRLRFPEDRTPGGRSSVTVDPYTEKVLFAQGSRTAPAGARVVIMNRAIHTGDIFGIPSKTLALLVSLLLALQVVSGVMMWWKRRESAPGQKAG